MNRHVFRLAICSLAAAMGVSRAAAAQEHPAAEAQRRLQLKPEQLLALYVEAAAVHNGFVYTLDVARFDDCAEGARLWAKIDTAPNRLEPLRALAKTSRYVDRFLFAMEPELREQVRAMRDHDRTGLVTLAGGGCVIAELVELKQTAMLQPEKLGPVLALTVDRGWLPHPDALTRDATLRSRTYANAIRTAADVESAPAGFDINTRRSNGYTILTEALLLNQADVARAALARGADPNLCGPLYCPLQLALTLRDDQQARELLELLLKAGANPNQIDRTQRARILPLSTAASGDLGAVERLVAAGAKPNGVADAPPPLFFAAANGNQAAVEYLIAHGADVLALDTSRPGLPNTLYTAARATRNPVFIDWIEQRMLDEARKSGQYAFDVWLEQDGHRVAAVGGAYRLKRAPFRLVVRLADPDTKGIVMASAETPAFQDDVRERAHDSAIFRSITEAAEEPDGKSDWLDVLPSGSPTGTAAIQYWFWSSDGDRRFSGRRGAGHDTEFYKDIRAIAVDHGSSATFQPVPIAEYAGHDLYIVAGVPVELSVFDQRFIDPVSLKITFAAER